MVDAELRHTTPLKVGRWGGSIKVGALFKNLNAQDALFISTYVFEEHRKLYSNII
jgi:hypothetical protein